MIPESLHILIPHAGNILLYTAKRISGFVIKLYTFILDGDDYVIKRKTEVLRVVRAKFNLSLQGLGTEEEA